MKKNHFHILLCILTIIFCVTSCREKKLPALITSAITKISFNSAISGGVILNDGGSTIIERGVCFNTNVDPTIKDFKTADGAGAGIFKSYLPDLHENSTYFVRAYATNRYGTGYGMALSFTTKRNSNLYLLYKQLVDDNYAVPKDYNQFENTFKNPENSKLLFDQLTKDNYAIPSDYDSFVKTFGLKKLDASDYGLPGKDAFPNIK